MTADLGAILSDKPLRFLATEPKRDPAKINRSESGGVKEASFIENINVHVGVIGMRQFSVVYYDEVQRGGARDPKPLLQFAKSARDRLHSR